MVLSLICNGKNVDNSLIFCDALQGIKVRITYQKKYGPNYSFMYKATNI